MGLFSKGSGSNHIDQGSKPIYENKYAGFWIKVYANRVDFKSGVGSQSIPINQVASVQLAMMGMMKITLETTGGKSYSIPTSKKKEVQQAIYRAQSNTTSSSSSSSSISDELTRLADLRDRGVLTNEEFEVQKKSILS